MGNSKPQPHPAYNKPLPRIPIESTRRFGWCCKIEGYVNKRVPLCKNCYYNLKEETIIESYKPIRVHFVLDGFEQLSCRCSSCAKEIFIQTAFFYCEICILEHQQFIANSWETERRLDEFKLIVISHGVDDIEIIDGLDGPRLAIIH